MSTNRPFIRSIVFVEGPMELRSVVEDKVRRISNVLSGRTYPKVVASRNANAKTVDFIQTTTCTRIAEIGIFEGYTTRELARYLDGRGELHLFDFSDRVDTVKQQLVDQGHRNVHTHGNSYKLLDSYNWSLMKVLRDQPNLRFDYVFLDGAHTWNVDALTFFLVDRLLEPDGYLDFDDYEWSLGSSPTLRPAVFPRTAAWYTDDQIREPQVKLIVDLLVKPDARYREIVPNKIYQKRSPH